MILSRNWCLQDVRRRFGLTGASRNSPLTIGAELELIPRQADSRLPVPIDSHMTACSVNIIRKLATRHSWCEAATGDGDPPSWQLASGARISFEPGGQIEVSSSPHESASALIEELSEITCALLEMFERHGAVLETKGVDAHNPISRIPLQLHRERYARMTQYFESIGPSGIRMMRQTASVQVNMEPGDDPLARWTLLNRMAPMLVAIFANSRRYAGEDSGHASYRANLWRSLDPTRTGLVMSETPVEAYCDFALNAGWIFAQSRTGEYSCFERAIESGASESDWDLHVSTLFPEIRPRNYFEIRSPDMVDLPWIAAPIVMITGICYHPDSAKAVSELLSRFDSNTLLRAGKDGLADDEIGSLAKDFVQLATRGAEALGADYIGHDDLDILNEFIDRYTANGLSPSDEM